MSSGQTYELMVDGIPNPLFTSKTYILFLTYDPCCDWFELDKSWIVENGRVHYVDDWDANSRYEGVSLEEFIHDYQQYRAAFVPGDAPNR